MSSVSTAERIANLRLGETLNVTLIHSGSTTADPTGTFAIYQVNPKLKSGQSSAAATAWLTYPFSPNPSYLFSWDVKYGVIFDTRSDFSGSPETEEADSVKGEDLQGDRWVLSKSIYGGYNFTSKLDKNPASAGTVGVNCDNSVLRGAGYVGITLDGKVIASTIAQPNYNITFSPNAEYWINYGAFTAGATMDKVQWKIKPYKLDFSASNSITITLDSNNVWTQMKI